MTGRFEGKVAVVTGGASGIGAGTVRRFAEEGASCVIADLQADLGTALADELGDAAAFVRTDVTDESQVEALVAAAVERFGRLDVMFNNAGILGAVGSICDITDDDWQATMAVLLDSVFYGIKHAGRVMRDQGSGSIVSTASTAGVRAGLGPHVYTAAKHAVVGLSQSAAVELARHGVRVNVICPGGTVSALTAYVATGDHTNQDKMREVYTGRSPLGRPGEPEDIANAVLYLAGDEASWVAGTVLVVDGAGEVVANSGTRFVDMGEKLVREAGQVS